jgi:hypothetical protein
MDLASELAQAGFGRSSQPLQKEDTGYDTAGTDDAVSGIGDGVYIYRSKAKSSDSEQINELEVLDNPVLSKYLQGNFVDAFSFVCRLIGYC